MLAAGDTAVIANVDGGRHFVLVVGCLHGGDCETLYVNDPGTRTSLVSLEIVLFTWAHSFCLLKASSRY